MHKFDTLQIIFNLKKRDTYINRYFNLLIDKNIKYNILIISDPKKKLEKNIVNKFSDFLYFSSSIKEIKGMNDIFRSFTNNINLFNKFKYICFLEDDNYIFPDAIISCEKFLNSSKDFIACNGLSFLFTKNNIKYSFLNIYSYPNFSKDNLIDRSIEYQKNEGLLYYSLIKSNIFTEICQKIKLIKDDNLSEVFFNYLLLLKGKVKTLKIIYLAREYPRPKVYNIPSVFEWMKNKKLLHDLNIIINELKNISIENQLSYKVLLKNTIFYYLMIRLYGYKHASNLFYIIKRKIFLFLLKKNSKVKYFLKKINSI